MPFANPEEVGAALTSPNNLINRIESHISQRGKRGDAVPEEIRRTIVTLTEVEGEKQTDVSEAFGIPQSAISKYKDGAYSLGTEEETEAFKKRIGKSRKDAEDKAVSALVESLAIMQPQLADVRKPKVLSSIAKDMAIIADKMRPAHEREGSGIPHIHFHIPDMKKVKDYEIIDLPSGG